MQHTPKAAHLSMLQIIASYVSERMLISTIDASYSKFMVYPENRVFVDYKKTEKRSIS